MCPVLHPQWVRTASEQGLEVCWEEAEGLQRSITLPPWVPDLQPEGSGEPVSMRICHVNGLLDKVCPAAVISGSLNGGDPFKPGRTSPMPI